MPAHMLCLAQLAQTTTMSRPFALVALVASLATQATAATNLTSLVNLFIGTASGANGGSGGNAFPGAAIPHAMAKVRFAIACLFIGEKFNQPI